MKTVILIASRFPFYPGEQFLEAEINYWATQQDIKVIVMPLSTGSGKKRELPNTIELDLSFAIKTKTIKKFLLIFKDLLSLTTYKKAAIDGALNYRFPIFLSQNRNYLESLIRIEKFLEKIPSTDNVVFYTYWHTFQTYALQTLKSKYHFKLISRIHGADIYQERKLFDYMPLKKQFTGSIDKIYTLVNSANLYLNTVYGYPLELLKTARLGVSDYKIMTKPTKKYNEIHVVSCASIVPIKRIDKIIDALDILSKNNNQLLVRWTHIGSGVIEKKIKNYLNQKKVVFSFNFIGDIKNKDVFKFYQNNNIDLFINTSESEGVPVSIMEAMSCHIPVIAPNVGGISDIVENNYNGILLSENCTVSEIVAALTDFSFFKRDDVRENAYETYLSKYSAEKNYPIFISDIKQFFMKD